MQTIFPCCVSCSAHVRGFFFHFSLFFSVTFFPPTLLSFSLYLSLTILLSPSLPIVMLLIPFCFWLYPSVLSFLSPPSHLCTQCTFYCMHIHVHVYRHVHVLYFNCLPLFSPSLPPSLLPPLLSHSSFHLPSSLPPPPSPLCSGRKQD